MSEREPVHERPIVVGVDGSDSSWAAVDVPGREAELRGRPLRVVHAWGGFAGPLLGSVSQAAMHHAHSPVAIVPDPSRRGTAGEGVS